MCHASAPVVGFEPDFTFAEKRVRCTRMLANPNCNLLHTNAIHLSYTPCENRELIKSFTPIRYSKREKQLQIAPDSGLSPQVLLS